MRLRAAVDNGALRLSPLYYDRGQQVAHSGWPHAESIIFNRGRSVAMWTFTGRVFFIPLNGRRPLNGHPPSSNYNYKVYSALILSVTCLKILLYFVLEHINTTSMYTIS